MSLARGFTSPLSSQPSCIVSRTGGNTAADTPGGILRHHLPDHAATLGNISYDIIFISAIRKKRYVATLEHSTRYVQSNTLFVVCEDKIDGYHTHACMQGHID